MVVPRTQQPWQRAVFMMLLLMSSATLTVNAETSSYCPEELDWNDEPVFFEPTELLKVQDGTEHTIMWCTNTSEIVHRVHVCRRDWQVSKVEVWGDVQEGSPENSTECASASYHGLVNVSALFLGFSDVRVTLYDHNNKTLAKGDMEMTVVLSYQNINDIFTFAIAVLTGILYFFMGATLELEVIKGIVKKPVGPVLGVICQYGVMPMIAYVLGLILFPNDALLRLGLFLNGCCPGGGASNMWTHLLGGSLDLSIMMTSVSTIAAFGTVPLWVYLMGPVILKDAEFQIPFVDITITVVSLIIPCCLGIALQIFFPKTVKYCSKVLTPLSAFNITFIFTFGVYAYRYVFEIFDWKMLLAGFLLPTLGYSLGMLLAVLFRRKIPEVIAIGVETGVQNATIALIILNITLDSPTGELSAVIPASSTLFTPLPLFVLLIIKKIYERTRRSSHDLDTSTVLKEVPKETPTDNEKAEEKSHNVGIDNPAADLKDAL